MKFKLFFLYCLGPKAARGGKHGRCSVALALALLFATVFVAGCNPPVKNSIATPSPALDNRPMIDHPEYKNWTKFPLGTTVIRRNEIVNSQGTVVVLTSLKLVDITEKLAVVESQTTVEREGRVDEKPPQSFEYFAKFPLMEGTNEETYSLPSPSALKTGLEDIEVSGSKYHADVFEWEGMLESGKVGLKQWRSDDFPGRIIRTETNYRDAANSTSIEWAVSITQGNSLEANTMP